MQVTNSGATQINIRLNGTMYSFNPGATVSVPDQHMGVFLPLMEQ